MLLSCAEKSRSHLRITPRAVAGGTGGSRPKPAPEARAGVAVCPRPTSDTKTNKTCEGGRTKRPKQECFPGLRLE